jgi:phage gp36-like protein
MGYATGADMLQRYDARLLGDLVSDDGTQVSVANLPTNGNLVALLTDAQAAIDAALFVGNRYTVAQLTTLSTTAQSFLRRLNCDLCLIYLKRRRGVFNSEKDGDLLKECDARIKGLRDGEDLLMQAVDTEAQASTLELDAPTMIPVLRRQTIRNQVRNYFPVQSNFNRQRGNE